MGQSRFEFTVTPQQVNQTITAVVGNKKLTEAEFEDAKKGIGPSVERLTELVDGFSMQGIETLLHSENFLQYVGSIIRFQAESNAPVNQIVLTTALRMFLFGYAAAQVGHQDADVAKAIASSTNIASA